MTSEGGRRRRRWIVATGIVAAAVALFAVSDRADPLDYYRPVGDRIIVVGTITGAATWTRVSSVTETPSEVVVAVRSFRVPFVPASGVGIPIEFVITLGAPLGERTVIDASDGHAVPKTRCLSYRPLCP
ncbi:MAG TPA: hypothetical protein VNO86_11750 [Candidatus Binatia bacterium]|nr:hypothetical protein [Candidatus Binatia bacterium]